MRTIDRQAGISAAGILGLLLLFSLAAPQFAPAQDSGALLERLRATEHNSSLDSSSTAPWHMKLDVQLYDAKGKPSEQGTIEAWWVSEDLRKVSYDFPSYKGSELHNRAGAFHSRDESGQPPILLDVLHQFVHPMNLDDIGDVKPDLRKQKFGKVELDCIMLDQPLKNVAFPPVGLFPTYCLDPGGSDLRISTELGSITFVRNRLGHFRSQSVSVDLRGESGDVTVVTAHLSALAGAALTDADFVPDATMEAVGGKLVRIGADVIAASSLKKVPPIYPEDAKRNRVQGTVVLLAVIGIDGHIHSLHIESTPDASLAMAAVAAVRQWTYKPYLLLGLPTAVDTTITVNFAFGPG